MKTILKTIGTITAALVVSASSLVAATVFSVAGGGISITGQNTGTAGTASGTAWTVNETMTAAGTLALNNYAEGPNGPVPINPLVSPFLATGHDAGAFITKTVLNNTGVTWTSFEMELQEILGTASPNGDGLSFAQGANLTFTSNVFTTVTRLEVTRDYLNFSGGSVADGASVSFTFAVTDNSPQSPIYLLQTPNKRDGGSVPDAGSTALLFVAGLAGLIGLRRKLC